MTPRDRRRRRVPAILAAWLIGAVAATLSPAAETSPPLVLRTDHLSARVPPQQQRRGKEILEIAESARAEVVDQMPAPLDERITLVWCDTEQEFYSRLGDHRGHLLAVAVASARRIYLNGPQMDRIGRGEIRRTLVHEFTHIYLGIVVPDEIPLWLNEGLAMKLAGEWGLDDATAVAAGSLFGRLLPIGELERRFPADAAGMRRAYRQSYSLTSFLIDIRYPQSEVRGLVADLADTPSDLRRALDNPAWVDTFEKRWLENHIRPGRLLLVLTSGGTLWLFVSLLLVYGYLRKRRAKRRRESQWAVEEEFGYQFDGFDD